MGEERGKRTVLPGEGRVWGRMEWEVRLAGGHGAGLESRLGGIWKGSGVGVIGPGELQAGERSHLRVGSGFMIRTPGGHDWGQLTEAQVPWLPQ